MALALLCSSGASRQILARGNEEQKAKYLPVMARGERLGACAVTELSGGANWPYTTQTTACLEEGSYVLNGTKCFACGAALEVTSQALQLFGAYGYTADFPLERYFRDARGLMIVGWPMEVRKLVVGRLELERPILAPLGPGTS